MKKTNTKLEAWKRYFTVAIKDLKVTSNKEIKKDIQNNIVKKLNKIQTIFTAEEMQEILNLFTESNQGKKTIENLKINNLVFTEMRLLKRDYTKLTGNSKDVEYKTSLVCEDRNVF